MNDELLALLLNIKHTLLATGVFDDFEHAPEDSELPFVFDKLESAIVLLTQDENNIYQSGCLH